MRKLAVIEIIKDIQKIEKADNLELVTVRGWQCIVEKGKYKIGDKVIYCEIDSFLPLDNPHFAFLKSRCLKKHNNGDKGYRIRSMKLRGVISQGIIFDCDILNNKNLNEGTDVTNNLNIILWEEPLNKNIKNNVPKNKFIKFMLRYKYLRKFYYKFILKVKTTKFPNFIKKTDEERIQNLTHYFNNDFIKDKVWECTEKMDGTSVTIYKIRKKFLGIFSKTKKGVCSRNLEIKNRDESKYWNAYNNYNMDFVLNDQSNIIIQGEICGPGIQKNKYKLKNEQLFIFNVIINGRHLNSNQINNFCKTYNLTMVPIIYKAIAFPDSIEEIIKLSEGRSVINPKIEREGLVWRNYDNVKTSFKVINNKFLIKYNE